MLEQLFQYSPLSSMPFETVLEPLLAAEKQNRYRSSGSSDIRLASNETLHNLKNNACRWSNFWRNFSMSRYRVLHQICSKKFTISFISLQLYDKMWERKYGIKTKVIIV